jgi:hypothetical protein
MFFNNGAAGGFEPKRSFRFTVSFPAIADVTFMAKAVTKPGYTLEGTEHRFLNHTFNFPNTVVWDEIEMSLIDAKDPNVGSMLYDLLLHQGYVPPTSIGNATAGITKINAVSSLGEVVIRQLDGGSITAPGSPGPGVVNAIETWTLKNAFITKLAWGELSYETDDLVEVTLGLKYDWANYNGTVEELQLGD